MSAHSKSRVFVCLMGLCLCTTSRGLADDRVVEALDLVNQLLAPEEALPPVQRANPFATTTTGAAISSQPRSKRVAKPLEVQLDSERIEIEVGGRKFVIDRTAENHPAVPAVNATERSTSQHHLGETLATAEMLQAYAMAVRDFQRGQFETSADRLQAFEAQLDGNGLVSQTYALVLFQQGEWQKAAEWAYTGVSRTSPFDWQTVSGIYGDSSAYAPRYRQLQTTCRQQPDRVDLRFLLAYHHLMLGHRDHAARELEFVQQSLDSDPVVEKLIQSIRAKPPQPTQPLK